MAIRTLTLFALVVAVLALAACAGSPPTATPGAAATLVVGQPTDSGSGTTIEITLPPPATPPPLTPEPIQIGVLKPYAAPDGRYSVDVPEGWQASANTLSPTSDVKLSEAFQPAGGNGLLTVTHFDNGKTPVSFSATVNGLLKQTGLTERPGYLELGREQVMDRKDSAMRVEILYQRANGMPMHSLLLFQLDGTVFSMVHAGVEEGSWNGNEEPLRAMLRSYAVPARANPTP